MPRLASQKRAAVRMARLRLAPARRKAQGETDDLRARVAALEQRVETLWGLPGHPGHKPHGLEIADESDE